MHRKKVIRISPHSKESAYNVGDPGLIMGREDPLVKGLATHASILAWRIPLDKGAWQATVLGVSESDTGEAT